MSKRAVGFRSKPIAFRSKPPKPDWQPSGCFRFLDLPPELRNDILKLMLLDHDSTHGDVLNLFLTSGQMYSEAASIFYFEVVLDTTQSKGSADPFLSGRPSRISSRRHVRNLTIAFQIKDQIHLFYDRYRPVLQDMVENGHLQSLRLEIRSPFPSAEFWGGSPHEWSMENIQLVSGSRKDSKVVRAPSFVAERPFQSFLKFLREANVPEIRLYVTSNDHPRFLCAFHRTHHTGAKCNGEWKGKATILKVKWKTVVKTLKGARLL